MFNKRSTPKRRRRLTKAQRKKQRFIRLCVFCSGIIIILGLIIAYFLGFIRLNIPVKKVDKVSTKVDLLTINEYSRPGTERITINGIVIHYVANPGTTAKNNRDYFEGLKDSKQTKASSHYIIGLDGEIIQAIPLQEVAYASNSRNNDTISIEVCHPDASGKFNKATYESLVKLTAWLCGQYDIKEEGIIRHYDITGKLCPLYYVEHEDAWKDLKKDVSQYIKKNGK